MGGNAALIGQKIATNPNLKVRVFSKLILSKREADHNFIVFSIRVLLYTCHSLFSLTVAYVEQRRNRSRINDRSVRFTVAVLR